MSGHTPGAWYVVLPREEGKHLVRSSHRIIAAVERTATEIDACDARLIAAAPDLLAACEEWLSGGDTESEPDIGMAEEAVAKARGETS